MIKCDRTYVHQCLNQDQIIKLRLFLLAMIKRNQAVPELAQIVDEESLSDLMLDRFITTYLKDEAHDFIERFKTEKIQPNIYSMSDWLTTQPSGTVELIENEIHISERDLTRYNFMIKSV